MYRVVIITGASRGIGAATAKLLASKGYSVCVNYRSRVEQAEAVVDEIIASGGSALAFQADVSREQDVIALFDATEQAFGSVTALVNNVGVLFNQSRLVDMDVERFNRVMVTNVTSCFLAAARPCGGCRTLAPL